MGIKKLTWKKVVGILVFIGTVITILTNLKFVWDSLKFLSYLVMKIITPLSNIIVRDVILFLLIGGILVWLVLTNRKLKKLPVVEGGKSKAVLKKGSKKEEVPEITMEHFFVLGYIADAPTSISQRALFESYKKDYPNSFMIDLKSTILDLMNMDYINRSVSERKESFYKITDEGVKFIKKIVEIVRNKEKSS